MSHKPASLLRNVYELSRPYGRKKLVFVFVVILIQGIFQVIGVTSIFPFLALASDPGAFRQSEIGGQLLSILPTMSDPSLLVVAGCFAILMLFTSNGLLLFGMMIRVRYAEGLGLWLRCRLLRRMISNPYEYFLQRNTGEMLKKAVSDVQGFVVNVLIPCLDALSLSISCLLLLVTLLIVDPIIALVAATGLGGFYLICFRVLRRRRTAHSRQMKSSSRGAMREAQQLLGGIKPIKIHQSEGIFLERYRRHSLIQSVLKKWQPFYNHAPRHLIEPLAFGSIVVIAIVTVSQGKDMVALLPKLGVMALAGYRLLPNWQLLYGALSQISLSAHSVEEIYEEFHDREEQSGTGNRVRRSCDPLDWSMAITIKKLTFRYSDGAIPLFNEVSLNIPKNAFVAFIGPTGSGKSTLVDLILGLHKPESGSIFVDETELGPATLSSWRASIGYVPQEIFLLDDSISANIAFGVQEKEIDAERVAEVARIAQIAEFIESELPEQYQSRVGERGVRLSGGQRQRIGLARALYHDPSTLVLDEATSALDDTTEAALMEAIESLHGEVTLIVIAHRLSTIQRADCVFELDHGQIVLQRSFPQSRGM